MGITRLEDGIYGRVAVLEAIMPRIENEIKGDLTYIRDNMVTKTEFATIALTVADNKKKIFLQQCQIIALACCLMLSMVIGDTKTLEVASKVAEKFITP